MDKKILNKLSSLVFYFSILLFIIAFNFAHNPPSGWYQQFLPNIGGRQISDVYFLDSLTGWAVTPYRQQQNDTAYVLKTTNGGDNWFISYSRTEQYVGFEKIYFLNNNTGFVCGANDFFSGYTGLSKSTDGGLNWISLNVPDPFAQFNDMSVLNEDTIWLASNSTGGGVFRTTDGGTNWIRQYNGDNPDKIYMYNSRIGFITRNFATPTLRKTTNGGFNWFSVLNEGFTDIHLIDSLTGWKCWGELDSIKKTTDGGTTWQKQLLPPTGALFGLSIIEKFSILDSNTLWGVGARGNTSSGFRGLIYKSTNGGEVWGYQLPDVKTINIGRYSNIDFVNQLNGWAYGTVSGVHTVKGGDTTIYITRINQTGLEIPINFKLFQNYPNPFNPTTTIEFKVKSSKNIKLTIYDIRGSEISVLVNEILNAGEYRYVFDAGSLSSGVYFYSLYADGKFVDTKKMVLVR